ncbi:MAG: DUF427 domain-containing protein [Woeseiaceae bacterium]|nr:DUF427 domain-containing protein [Woeseiaceae bacterium]
MVARINAKDETMWEHTGRRRPDFAAKPGPGQESVWDYPRPPALVADSRRIVVSRDDIIVADTRRSLRLCETASPPTFYLPPDDVQLHSLVPADGASICEWKGAAIYLALKTDPETAVAWSYPRPRARYDRLKNYIAFYPALVKCLVDGEQVRPQPGRFYGGWVTSDIVGPFKGEPGTGHW